MNHDAVSWLVASTQLALEYGRNHGELWARHWARPDELRHLASFCGDLSVDEWDDYFDDHSGHAKAVGDRLYAVIRPEGDQGESQDFWRWTVGADTELTGYQIRGFVEGVLDEL